LERRDDDHVGESSRSADESGDECRAPQAVRDAQQTDSDALVVVGTVTSGPGVELSCCPRCTVPIRWAGHLLAVHCSSNIPAAETKKITCWRRCRAFEVMM
jgi:hypothetical protein